MASVNQDPSNVVLPGSTVTYTIAVSGSGAYTQYPQFSFQIGTTIINTLFTSLDGCIYDPVDSIGWRCPGFNPELLPKKEYRFSWVPPYIGVETILIYCSGSCSGSQTVVTAVSAPDVLAFSPATYTVNEDAGAVALTVQRIGDGVGMVTVDYHDTEIYSTEALRNVDYSAVSGQLVWAVGDTSSRTITVPILEDDLTEGSESFWVDLENPSSAAVLSSSAWYAQVTIYPNDPSGELRFTSSGYTVDEDDGTATISVERVNGTGNAVSVNYATSDGTASAAKGDYAPSSGTLSWSAGQGGTKTFLVTVLTDDKAENPETVQLTLSGVTGGAALGTPSTATLTINDTTPRGELHFVSSSYSGDEGGTGRVTVTRTDGSAGAVSVDFSTADGTATEGSDYTERTGTIWWADGNTDTKLIFVDLLADGTADDNETVLVSLSNPTGGATLGTPSTATLTINDTTPVGQLQFSSATYSGDEGEAATIGVIRTGGTGGGVSVGYATSPGTATAGSDYVSATGTLSWADGDASTKTISVTLLNDGTADDNETVLLSLTGPTGGATLGAPSTATLTINDASPQGQLQFTSASYSGDEGAAAAIGVSRTGGSAGAVSVGYASAPGSATAGSDYLTATGTLSWTDGDASTKTISVTLLNDGIVDDNETVLISLSNPTGGATLGTPGTATLTIHDTTPRGQLQFTSASYSGDEGAAATVGVSRTGGSAGPVSVSYATSPGTATANSDYVTSTGTLSWADGDTGTKTISVTLLNDGIVDDNEYVLLTLSNPSGGAVLGSPSAATLTINDTTPPGYLVVSPNTVFSAFAEVGATFNPEAKTYTLINTGEGALTFAVEPSVNWLVSSPISGELAPGVQRPVVVSIDHQMLDMLPGTAVRAEIRFVNLTDGAGDTSRWVSLVVLPEDSDWQVSDKAGGDDGVVLTTHPIENGEAATLRLSVAPDKQLMPPCNIGFDVKTSTEADKDTLRFSINGLPQGDWSGDTDWTPESFPVPAGLVGDMLELEWTYEKDGSGSSGEDAVSVDDIYPSAFDVRLASSVLPGSRSARVGDTVTAFATIINAGADLATDCGIALGTALPGDFGYQTTDPVTNTIEGLPNTPVDIAAGGIETFVIGFTPSAPLPPIEAVLTYDCSNSSRAKSLVGVNTLLLSASAVTVPDVVALAATLNSDGIVTVPSNVGTGVFAVATVNVGSGSIMRVTADTGSSPNLPVTLTLCQTNPVNGQCIQPPAAQVTTTIGPGATPTFGVFVAADEVVPFNPATNRVFVRFADDGGVVRGATSVAVRTQ